MSITLLGYVPSFERKEVGAYTILHCSSGKQYHGSTDDINRRIIEHKGDLTRHEHGNPGLTECFLESPVFELFFYKTYDITEARNIEQQLIDNTDKNKLLNVSLSVINTPKDINMIDFGQRSFVLAVTPEFKNSLQETIERQAEKQGIEGMTGVIETFTSGD